MSSQPPNGSRAPTARAILVFAVAALAVLALDLASKSWVFDLLRVRGEGVPPRIVAQQVRTVIPRLFELEATYNYGAVAGSLSGHGGWLTVISVAALALLAGALIRNLRRGPGPELGVSVALGLLVGGIAGNLHDRVAYGAVRDWIKWFVVVRGHPCVWPNFNIADAAICVAVGLLLLREIVKGRIERRVA